MNGNGCAGSIASGVTSGKMFLQVVARAARLLRPRVRLVVRQRCGCRARASSLEQLAAAARAARALELARSRRSTRRSAAAACGRRRVSSLHAGADLLLQAADALHEELVEVRRRDGEELDPLEQRVGLVGASARTRRLNASQVSSRLRYSSGALRSASIRTVAGVAPLTLRISATAPAPLATSMLAPGAGPTSRAVDGSSESARRA